MPQIDISTIQWAHIEPLIPPGKPGGGKRRVAGVSRILSTGWRCPRICRPEAPCMITSACGTTLDRRCAARKPRAIHRQSLKKGGHRSHGYAGKLIQEAACSGRYLLLHGIVTAADVQDRTAVSCFAVCFPFSGNCSPTAPIRGRSFTAPWPALPDLETEISSDPIG